MAQKIEIVFESDVDANYFVTEELIPMLKESKGKIKAFQYGCYIIK
jgi:hypothetical protein